MNKIISTICFYLIFILFLSCERPDLTDAIEWAYYHPTDGFCSNPGTFRCGSDISYVYVCYQGKWEFYERCTKPSTCNTETGSCSYFSENECPIIDGYMWSSKSSSTMEWDDAVSYCDNLTECGYTDWHLPTISELRTLIQNCSGTVTGGSCGVTDNCLSSSCRDEDSCWSCSYDDSGKYSKLGDTNWFWSSSTNSDNTAWLVDFNYGHVGSDYKYDCSYVRCVR